MKRTVLLLALIALWGIATAQGSYARPYVTIGEWSNKTYIANNLIESYADVSDFFDTTYLIVFNVTTKTKDTLEMFETATYDGSGFIDFHHCANGKIYYSESSYRAGSTLSCIDMRTDKVKRIASDIVSDDNGVPLIHIKNGRLYYTKRICINEEAQYESDKEYINKEYSILL